MSSETKSNRTAAELADLLDHAVSLTNGWTWSREDVDGLREAAALIRRQSDALRPFARVIGTVEFGATLQSGLHEAPDDFPVVPNLRLTVGHFRLASLAAEGSNA